jgi:hypothetical protein
MADGGFGSLWVSSDSYTINFVGRDSWMKSQTVNTHSGAGT